MTRPGALDHGRAAEQRCDLRAVERRRHREQAQLGRDVPLRVEREREPDVGVEIALVKLVEQHRADAVERRVALQHPREHAFGDDLDPRALAHARLEPHAVADRVADGLAQRCAIRTATARAAMRGSLNAPSKNRMTGSSVVGTILWTCAATRPARSRRSWAIFARTPNGTSVSSIILTSICAAWSAVMISRSAARRLHLGRSAAVLVADHRAVLSLPLALGAVGSRGVAPDHRRRQLRPPGLAVAAVPTGHDQLTAASFRTCSSAR